MKNNPEVQSREKEELLAGLVPCGCHFRQSEKEEKKHGLESRKTWGGGGTAKFYNKNIPAYTLRQVIKFQVLYLKMGIISPPLKYHYEDQMRNIKST